VQRLPEATAEDVAVSVVVPVFNSEKSLEELVERLVKTLGKQSDYEIVLVNDGSRDGSWAVIDALALRHSRVRGYDMFRNFGQHNALLAGIRQARHPVIVTLDDDLQHRPEDIPVLLAALTADVDLVYANSAEEEHRFWRNASSRMVKGAMAMSMGTQTARMVSAFRAFRTSLRDSFDSSSDPFVSIDVLLSWVTTRVAAVDVVMEQRSFGESNYTFRKLAKHAINMMTGYSAVPLRLVTYVGFGFALVGVGIFAYVVARFFLDSGSVPGFPFLASVIAVLSGAQLFALGLIGEYLGRMHFRSMQKPAYAIRRVVGSFDAAEHDSEEPATPVHS
jgi:undecaprenyl-phosphate 4-deoxy-4-formamido-L-arabinose transferase